MSSFTNLHPDVAASILTAEDVADLANVTDPQEGDIRYVKDVGLLYTYNGSAWVAGAGGGVQPPSPAISTDGAVVRWDGTGATAIQDSPVTISDGGVITGATSISVDSLSLTDGRVNTSSGPLRLNAASDQIFVDADLTLRDNTTLVFLDADGSNSITVSIPAVVTTSRSPQIPDGTGDFVLTTAAQTLTSKTIVAASNTIATAASGNLTSTNLNAALAELQGDIDTRATTTALSDHITDTTDAHDASAISNIPSGNLLATDVQDALNELQSDVDLRELASNKGISGGYASLDGGGKIPVTQLPNSIMEYLGTWVASTNTPTLANGTGNAGDVYIASDTGTVNFGAGNLTFAAGDWVVYSGAVWEKSINSNAVASVFSRTGAVVSANGDYTASQVTNVPSGNLAAVTTQAAINELQTDVDTRVLRSGDTITGNVGIGTAPTAKLDVDAVSTSVTGIKVKAATGQDTIQYLSSAGVNLYRANYDGFQVHHYYGSVNTHNLGNNSYNFESLGSGYVLISRLYIDGAQSNPDSRQIRMGGLTYATAVHPLTDMSIGMTSFAWDGSSGSNITSGAQIKFTQLTANAGDARLDIGALTPSISVLTSSGNVGIGTTNPLSPLHIQDATTSTSTRIIKTSTTGRGLLISMPAGSGSSGLEITHAGSGVGLSISTGISSGTALELSNNSSTNATASLQNSHASGTLLDLRGATSGSIKVQVPNAITSHTLTLPSAQGAAGSIVQNDGSGILSWATTLPIANGGTGQSTAQLGINALAGAVTDNRVLQGNGTNIVLGQIDDPTFFLAGAAATAGGIGILSYYKEEDLNISNLGSFNVGQPVMRITRTNKTVTLTWPSLAHTSTTNAVSSATFIPVEYRPAHEVNNVYLASASFVRNITLGSGGQLNFEYFNWAGVGTADISTRPGTLTWVID